MIHTKYPSNILTEQQIHKGCIDSLNESIKSKEFKIIESKINENNQLILTFKKIDDKWDETRSHIFILAKKGEVYD